jgi:magnesium chelatase family protein
MALAKSLAVSLLGLTATQIEVEADISSQLPNFILVGLPDASLSEANARVRAAVTNSGLAWPARRITVNLSPASVPKQGSSFDLAIAMAVLAASQTDDSSRAVAASVAKTFHIGELTLDGSVRAVPGVLPMVKAARDLGAVCVMVPLGSLAEASLITGVDVVGVTSLKQALAWHAGVRESEPQENLGTDRAAVVSAQKRHDLDISDVRGQDFAVNSLLVAAAGGHHMLMVGSPGAGKTMLAERLPTLLPDLSIEAALESAAVASIFGRSVFGREGEGLDLRPKFEAPHHSASMSAIVGGGLKTPRPGAISLAHNGVLFLDEAPEFQTPVLDALRQPLESGEIRLHRSAGTAVFPARCQLVMAANPCPCGKAFLPAGCQCSAMSRARYGQKLSGPLLDRIDIRLVIQPVSAIKMRFIEEAKQFSTLTSSNARVRVQRAQDAARDRLLSTPWKKNSQVSANHLRGVLKLSGQVTETLDKALNRGRVSMRGYDRCLRLAWTIADLAGHESPSADDVAMALALRGEDSPLGIAS